MPDFFVTSKQCDEYREDEPGLDVDEGQRYLLNNSTITKLTISKPKGLGRRGGWRAAFSWTLYHLANYSGNNAP